MKSIFTYTVLSLMSLLILNSCINKEKNNSSETRKNELHTGDSGDKVDDHSDADWKLVWSDDFDGVRIDTNNWNYQIVEAGRFNDEWQRYTDSDKNAFIEDGNLVIKAIHESEVHGMDQYTSARMHTANKQAWKYGKIIARMKLPKGNGIWPAFWMLGANINENGGDTPWPQSGEIDIMEFYGSKDESVVEANIHYADKTDSHKMMGAVPYRLKEGNFTEGFHVFELEWGPESISWFLDGEKYATVDITSDEFTEFHEEFFILLNVAVGGRHAGRPDESTKFPQQMYIDWVRVYQRK
ncbi:MAG: glycoside hydrolase family 16 protein [Flavobacteriaceae bacterium]|nr:MAG: glycoside hydrolase family 16 protein [Flavobacteriaceae bacterium]